MTTLMSLPQNGCAEATLTSSKSKNSAITATIHKRRWLSRLLLLAIVFCAFASNLNAQSDFNTPLRVAMVVDNNADSTDWLIDEYMLYDAMTEANVLTCETDTCDSTYNEIAAAVVRYGLSNDGNYYLYFVVVCPCSDILIDSIMLANINDTLYLYEDANKPWIAEVLTYMNIRTHYAEYYPPVTQYGYWYVDGKWRWGRLEGIHLFGNWYYGNLYYYDDNNKLQSSQWFYEWRATPPSKKIANGLVLQGFKFNLLPGNNLQVMTSMDAQCDVYELETGKLLLQNVDIIGNNSYQAISIKPSNTPYVIIFKVNNEPVSLQHFIFNNSTNLSIGNQNE